MSTGFVRTDMDHVSTTHTLSCSECGQEIEETGYLPAIDRDDEYEPLVEAAICDACGFNDIGMMGCAPELDEVIDPGPDDVLLYVRMADDGVEVVSTKD